MMHTSRLTLPALAVAFLGAAGCAPGAASSQETPPAPRPNVYEVGPEHLAALTAARDSQPSTLQVSGSAEVSVPVDRARVDFAVETESASAREAASRNADRMEAVIRALRQAGVAGLSVQTHGYRLNPRYGSPDAGRPRDREIVGYTAVNHIRATVDDPSAVGTLIDAAVGAGANRVASLTFEASDPSEAKLEALREAVRQARAEAEAIAGAMGVRLGRPLSVSGGAPVSPPRPMAEMAMAEMARTPVEPGDQTVSANVTITYALVTGAR